MSNSYSSLKLNRREFLRIIGAGVALTGVGAIIQACAPAPTPTAVPTHVPPTMVPTAVPLTASKENEGGNMFARLTTAQILPGKMDDTISIMRDSIGPAIKQLEGSKGYLMLTDRKMGKAIAIVLWETENAMIASETNGFYQQQLGKLKDVFGAPPTRENYEVSVQS